jgi:hypothetical protein
MVRPGEIRTRAAESQRHGHAPFARHTRVGLLARERGRREPPVKHFRPFPGETEWLSRAALTYSGGTAPALDRLPCYALAGTRCVC